MATRFLGPDFQINIDTGQGEGILGAQTLPAVTTLADGRFAVIYQSDHGGVSGDPDPIAAIFNPDGSSSSLRYDDVYNIGFAQTEPAIAARNDGGFGVVFTNQLHADAFPDASGPNITYVAVGADGHPMGPALAIGDFDIGGRTALLHPAIATLASGRQVVAFERIFVPGDDDVFLNVVSADGKSTERPADGPFAVANDGNFQADPSVAASGEKALVVYEDSRNTTLNSRNIVARIFDGTRDEFDDQFTIADHSSALKNAKVAALDDHRFVIVYTDSDHVFGKIYDANNGSLSPEFSIVRPGLFDLVPDVSATADGGFLVTWAGTDGVKPQIRVQRFNSDGLAMGDSFVVSEPSPGDQINPMVAVSGANAFIGWGDFGQVSSSDTDPPSVRAQVLSLTTQPDFNDNGVSDILWRNDNGSVVAWDMNRNGSIGGSAELKFGGIAVRPDAGWSIAGLSDFNGDGRADVLWRNSGGPLALWTVNGNTITDSASVKDSAGNLVQPDASWSVAGVGDFNFDGKSDILWRNSGGSLAVWSMNGSTIASSGLVTSGGRAVSLDASWSVAGAGDFNADGKTDVIWRSASGEIVEWQMNGSAIAGSADLNAGGRAVRPDASWSIAGVGDFNADGKSDLLWRNSNGSLVEWLMDGSSIMSSSAVTSGGAVVAPDASWHVVEIGDFNLDARTDILWRNDNGTLAEWMMNGNRIASTATPSFNGSAEAPDASWHTQAKPTDFG
jgi:VCBS repeat protein